MTSQTDDSTSLQQLDGSGSAEGMRSSQPHAFCPDGGLCADSSGLFRGEVRSLLSDRLRGAASILSLGFVGFLIRNFLIRIWNRPGGTELLIGHAVVTVLIVGLTVLLFRCRELSFAKLRIIEAVTFALPAVFFVWLQFCLVCYCPAEHEHLAAAAFTAKTAIPWIMLLQVYGIFIPNSWKRAASVVAGMAVIPIIGALAIASQSPAVAAMLFEGGLSELVLWIAIASCIAVYGSHRFGTLRRETFNAKRIGAYNLLGKLGSGGMGDVYLAEHHLLKRRCAIKLIKPEKANDPGALARFESEVQAAARLTHLNTIEIYDYGHTRDGVFFYSMEYLPGLNLQQIVDRFGPMPPERVGYFLRQICSALKEAHAAGLIHRDIKPGNIFASERGGVYDVAKLLDFGLVKSINADTESMKLTLDGMVVGSPLFASPETITDGEPDERSDIYSLGATAYFLLTGRPVFSGSNPLKVIFAHVNETPRLPAEITAGIPAELESIVMTCLKKHPAERFANVSEMEQALGNCHFTSAWTPQRAALWWQGNSVNNVGTVTAKTQDELNTQNTVVLSPVSMKG